MFWKKNSLSKFTHPSFDNLVIVGDLIRESIPHEVEPKSEIMIILEI